MIYQVEEGSLEYKIEKNGQNVDKNLEEFFRTSGCDTAIYITSVTANPELKSSGANVAKVLASFARTMKDKIVLYTVSKKAYAMKYGEKSVTMQLINIQNILNVSGFVSLQNYLPDDDLMIFIYESVKSSYVKEFYRMEDAAFVVGEIFNVDTKEQAFKFCDIVSKGKPDYLKKVRDTINEYLNTQNTNGVEKVKAF